MSREGMESARSNYRHEELGSGEVPLEKLISIKALRESYHHRQSRTKY
jgi:hypothetical protein